MDRQAVLPPIGMITEADHASATIYLQSLCQESLAGSEQWQTAAETNLEIYTYGASPQPASNIIVSNQIQDAVNAVTDFQTKQPPIRSLSPIERDDPGETYYMDPAGGVSGPYTPQQAQQMQQQSYVAGVDAMGQPQMQAAFDPANFLTINDKSTADFFQKPHDLYWQRGQLDQAFRDAVHWSTIFGFLFPIYQFDTSTHRPKLWVDISLKDIYPDATRHNVNNMAFFGVDWWIDAEQAKVMFPHLADIIEERARTGIPERPGMETSLPDNVDATGGVLRRNSIILRVFWLRNQPCPYPEDEALAVGLLERRMIPLGDPGAVIENETAEFPKGYADEQQVGPSAGVPKGGDGVDGQSPGLPVGLGQHGLFLPGTQTQVKPPAGQQLDPNWPMYRSTRQITAVLGLVVDDRECEYWDIPVLQLLSSPIPYTCFGQGLPARLAAIQDARNKMLTGIADHTELNAHPVMMVPRSAWDVLPEKFKQHGAKRAGMTVVVPDDVLRSTPDPASFIQPPPMNEALVEGQNIFHNELTERSGNPDVLAGKPPPGVQGWQAIQLLSQNASSRFGFSMQWTRDMVWRLSMLLLHDLIDPRKVTPRDLQAIDSRYPIEIIEAFQRHGQMMDWDFDIDIQTGVSGARNRKQAETMQLFQTRDPISGDPVASMETVRDVMGLDNAKEQQRNDQARERAMAIQSQGAAMQAAMAPQPQPQEQQSPVDRPSFGGNGRISE